MEHEETVSSREQFEEIGWLPQRFADSPTLREPDNLRQILSEIDSGKELVRNFLRMRINRQEGREPWQNADGTEVKNL